MFCAKHKQKSRFLHTGENVMFAVLEYFKLLAQKPTNLANFFQLTIILHVVYLWGWEGGEVGWVGRPRTRKYKSIKQTIRFLSNGKVSLLYYQC